MRELVIWILFVSLNLAWAGINADITLSGKKTYHGWNALLYVFICLLGVFLAFRDQTLIWLGLYFISVCFLHLSVFPFFYNIFRNVDGFNLSLTTTSIIDRIMIKIGLKNTLLINIGAFVLSLTLLICLLHYH